MSVPAKGGPMTIAVGDVVPDVELRTLVARAPQSVRSAEVLGKGRVVLFAVPGAFTPTCSDHHLPGFVRRAAELRQKGVDTIACIAVNDAFVMGAWARDQRVGDAVVMLADGNGDFARAMGLEADLRSAGLGMRSQRYAAVIDDGVVSALYVEPERGLSVSSAEAVLAAL
jgi:glutaredoxin/glutathione-dependent peroxiredoxin